MTSCAVTVWDTEDKPYAIQGTFTGSSREEEIDTSEELENLFLLLIRPGLDFLYRGFSQVFQVDASSLYPLFKTGNETYLTRELSEEEIISEIVESRFIVRMSPVKEYTVRMKIESVEKAIPRIVEPEGI